MDDFIINGVYYFDTIYARCSHKVNHTDCECNNGYICGHKARSDEEIVVWNGENNE